MFHDLFDLNICEFPWCVQLIVISLRWWPFVYESCYFIVSGSVIILDPVNVSPFDYHYDHCLAMGSCAWCSSNNGTTTLNQNSKLAWPFTRSLSIAAWSGNVSLRSTSRNKGYRVYLFKLKKQLFNSCISMQRMGSVCCAIGTVYAL